MGRSLTLDVADWAAIVSGESAAQLGSAADVSALPDNQRRRLPAFAREMIRCTLPLLADAPTRPLILAASHGDMQSTVKLLTDLAHREILSPSVFALSVHNAAPGALSLALKPPGDQTALAGNKASLAAGLVEAYARLSQDDVDAAVVAFAEAKLPEIYADHDEAAPDVFVSLVVRLASAEPRDAIEVGAGRAGAAELVQALSAGKRRVSFELPRYDAMAA